MCNSIRAGTGRAQRAVGLGAAARSCNKRRPFKKQIQKRTPLMLDRRACFAFALLGLCATSASEAQSAFPYDRDMVLDARPMRGSKRVPILAIAEGGEA